MTAAQIAASIEKRLAALESERQALFVVLKALKQGKSVSR